MATSHCQTLEEILATQWNKLEMLETATVFVKSKDALKEDLREMRSQVSCISKLIGVLKTKLSEMKDQNEQCKELISCIKALDKRIIHMEKNVPSELIRDYHNKENTTISINVIPEDELTIESEMTESDIEKPDNQMQTCKKILFAEPEVYPIIPLITQDEFIKLPKYIIGRQSLETLNNLVNTINQILKAKYTFLSLGKVHARKQGDMNLYMHYKKQELDICKDSEYVYFFTAEDYERQTKTKLCKTKINLITVLRHCKRLREHRVKNDLRYVIITN